MNGALIYNAIIERFGIKTSALEKKLGFSNGAIRDVIARNGGIKSQTLEKILELYPEISKEWLYSGVGEMIKTNSEHAYKMESNAAPISLVEESESYYNRFGNVFEPLEDGNYLMQVPIITEYARGGRMAGFSDREYFDELPKHTVVVDKIHKGKYLSFRVAGESMDFDGRDAILDGAIVTGRELKQELWRNSKLHLNKYKDFIIAGAEGLCVKRIIEHNVEEGYIVCHSLNPNKTKYKDFTLRIDDIDALFNIIKVENPR